MCDQNPFIKLQNSKTHEALLHHNLNECRATYLVFIEEVPEAFSFLNVGANVSHPVGSLVE